MTLLSEQDLKKAQDYATRIDLYNQAEVMQYAAAAQRKLAKVSGSALHIAGDFSVERAAALTEQLLDEIRQFSKKKGFLGLGRRDDADWIEDYKQTQASVNALSLQLEQMQFQLYKDMGLYQQLAQKNLQHRRELDLYLQAGQFKLDTVKSLELPALEAQTKADPSLENSMTLDHLQQQTLLFEKKLHDLEISRVISQQFETQLSLLHDSARLMSEKLQSTIQQTIPLWNNQISLALGLEKTRQSMEAGRKVQSAATESFADKQQTIEQVTEMITEQIARKQAELLALGEEKSTQLKTIPLHD